jgi:uncharacterized protein YbgA (DUF1722 family)
MSTSIRMNPITEVEYVDYGACGSLSSVLAEMFGDFPIKLTRDDLAALEAAALGYRQGTSPAADNPFQQIYDYLEKHGEIVLEREN